MQKAMMGTSSTGNFPLQRAAGRCKAVRAPGVKSSRSCRPKGVCAWVGPDGVSLPLAGEPAAMPERGVALWGGKKSGTAESCLRRPLSLKRGDKGRFLFFAAEKRQRGSGK